MKALSEHNRQRLEEHWIQQRMSEPHVNGIACPKCGLELWDSNPSLTLASNPPQKNVHCPKCKYSGFRLA